MTAAYDEQSSADLSFVLRSMAARYLRPVTQARADCEASCRDGVGTFKSTDWPKLCGLLGGSTMGAGPATCHLCVDDRNVWIANCRDLMDIGENNCVAGCGTADPDEVGVNFRISSSSGAIKRTFPSRIDP